MKTESNVGGAEANMGRDLPRVLMIAYHFYPDVVIGAIRTIKFAKYLPEFGWNPVILTVADKYYPVADDAPLGFDCTIYRTRKWPVLRDIYMSLKPYLRRGKRDSPPAAETSSQPGSLMAQPTDVSLLKRAIFSLSWLPDDKMGWIVPAVFRALRILRTDGIDVIYSSGPPNTGHLIALALKMLTGKPWVADFRDPWEPLLKVPHVSTAFSRWLENRMAHAVAARADAVVTVSPALRDSTIAQFGGRMSSKCLEILNGYDDEDFEGRCKAPRKPGDPITFLYAGNLYSGRDPSDALIAFGELLASGRLRPDEFSVRFMGTFQIDMEGTRRLLQSYGLENIIRFAPPVKRQEYLDRIVNADVLLGIQGGKEAVAIPGKTFEYLATGNQIVAVTNPGAASELLAGFDNVHIAGPGDKNGIKECIMSAVGRVKAGQGNARPAAERMNFITRKHNTGKLAEVLNEALKKR